ncbi:hypothetical protein S40288_11424 [Stachybotrys chartarum IBT 40288]|nr:hypothetical protein S40288_11424 [Stachybotrys chartarum IBT 40288]
MASRSLKPILSKIEVERKFNPGSNFWSVFSPRLVRLSRGGGKQVQQQGSVDRPQGPCFTVISQPPELIQDTYYDTVDGDLAKLCLWVRQRRAQSEPNQEPKAAGEQPLALATGSKPKPKWNAKLRLAGHFNNSQFAELYGKTNVSNEVPRVTDSAMKLEDLRVFANLQTRRSTWEVTQLPDGTAPSAKMTVVMDEVTEAHPSEHDKPAFSHTVGEVELFQSVTTERKDSSEHDAYRKEVSARRMEELEGFMRAYPAVFSTNPKPLGKLSAYDVWSAAWQPSPSTGEAARIASTLSPEADGVKISILFFSPSTSDHTPSDLRSAGYYNKAGIATLAFPTLLLLKGTADFVSSMAQSWGSIQEDPYMAQMRAFFATEAAGDGHSEVPNQDAWGQSDGMDDIDQAAGADPAW